MSYDETKGRNDVKIFSDADYDYDKEYKENDKDGVVPGSVLDQFLKDTDNYDKDNVVRNAGKQIMNEPYIMIHVFPVFMIAYGKLIAKKQQLMLGGGSLTDTDYIVDIAAADNTTFFDKWVEIINSFQNDVSKNNNTNLSPKSKKLITILNAILLHAIKKKNFVLYINPMMGEDKNPTLIYLLEYVFKQVIELLTKIQKNEIYDDKASFLEYIRDTFPTLFIINHNQITGIDKYYNYIIKVLDTSTESRKKLVNQEEEKIKTHYAALDEFVKECKKNIITKNNKYYINSAYRPKVKEFKKYIEKYGINHTLDYFYSFISNTGFNINSKTAISNIIPIIFEISYAHLLIDTVLKFEDLSVVITDNDIEKLVVELNELKKTERDKYKLRIDVLIKLILSMKSQTNIELSGFVNPAYKLLDSGNTVPVEWIYPLSYIIHKVIKRKESDRLKHIQDELPKIINPVENTYPSKPEFFKYIIDKVRYTKYTVPVKFDITKYIKTEDNNNTVYDLKGLETYKGDLETDGITKLLETYKTDGNLHPVYYFADVYRLVNTAIKYEIDTVAITDTTIDQWIYYFNTSHLSNEHAILVKMLDKMLDKMKGKPKEDLAKLVNPKYKLKDYTETVPSDLIYPLSYIINKVTDMAKKHNPPYSTQIKSLDEIKKTLTGIYSAPVEYESNIAYFNEIEQKVISDGQYINNYNTIIYENINLYDFIQTSNKSVHNLDGLMEIRDYIAKTGTLNELKTITDNFDNICAISNLYLFVKTAIDYANNGFFEVVKDKKYDLINTWIIKLKLLQININISNEGLNNLIILLNAFVKTEKLGFMVTKPKPTAETTYGGDGDGDGDGENVLVPALQYNIDQTVLVNPELKQTLAKMNQDIITNINYEATPTDATTATTTDDINKTIKTGLAELDNNINGLAELDNTTILDNLTSVLRLYASGTLQTQNEVDEQRKNDAKIRNRISSAASRLSDAALSRTAALGSTALYGTAALGTNAVSSASNLGTYVLGSASSALNSAKSKLSNISIPGTGQSAVVVHRPAFVKISNKHSQYMALVLNTLAAIDELRAPGWLEAIRSTLGAVTGMFDEGSSMNSFISAISNYDETKNKYRASMYAEVSLLRSDDRLNGQPKCTDEPIDVNIIVEQKGPSAITRVNSALNAIMHDLEEKPEITTNPVGLEAGANPNNKPGRNLVVKNLKEDEFEKLQKITGGRKTKRSLSTHKKRQNNTRRSGLRSQFGIK